MLILSRKNGVNQVRLSLLFGGFILIAVDAVSGRIYRLIPEQVHAEMRSENIAYSKKGSDSYMDIVLKPKADW